MGDKCVRLGLARRVEQRDFVIDHYLLAQRIRDSQLLVYSQCASLAGTVLTTYCRTVWPASFVVYPDQVWGRQVASTISVAEGSAYTLWVLFVFMPVFLIHSEWVAASADAAQKATVDLAEKATVAFVAMFGPTVVGLFAKVLG